MRRILVRLPETSITWLDDNSAKLGISRDAFVRQIVGGMRESWSQLSKEGTDENLFFARLEDKLVSTAQQATKDAVSSALRAFGGVPPKGHV